MFALCMNLDEDECINVVLMSKPDYFQLGFICSLLVRNL